MTFPDWFTPSEEEKAERAEHLEGTVAVSLDWFFGRASGLEGSGVAALPEILHATYVEGFNAGVKSLAASVEKRDKHAAATRAALQRGSKRYPHG